MDHDEVLFSMADLAYAGLPAGDDGVIVGEDERGRPAVLATHHPVPYEMVLIGGVWMAQVLALRAVAAGIRVMVETRRTAVWSRVFHAADQEAGRIGTCAPGAVPPLVVTVGSPVLVIRDGWDRASRAGGRALSTPWQPVLTLVPRLDSGVSRLVEQAALVGVQRVTEADSKRLGRSLGLSAAESESLLSLSDDLTLWCARQHRRLVRLVPTDGESGLLGVPRRADPAG